MAATAVDGTALSQLKQGQQITTTAVPVVWLLDEVYHEDAGADPLATLVLPSVPNLVSGVYEGWIVSSKGMSEDFNAGTIIITHRHRGFVPANGDLVVAKRKTLKGIVHSLRYYATSDASSWLWMKSGKGDASAIATELLRFDAEYPAIVGLVVSSYKLEIPAKGVRLE